VMILYLKSLANHHLTSKYLKRKQDLMNKSHDNSPVVDLENLSDLALYCARVKSHDFIS